MLDFLGIGAHKSGTTWLFKRMVMHPNIHFPKGKEMHFWDRADVQNDTAIRRYMRIFADGYFHRENSFKIGEITPAYATLSEDRISALHSAAPDVRLFYCLRNPSDRAWSATKMRLRLKGKDPGALPIEEILSAVQDDFIVSHSSYSANVRRWLTRFRREQIHFILFDDIRSSPHAVLEKVCRHLEVDKTFFDLIPPKVIQDVVFEGTSTLPHPDIQQDIYRIFEPEIAECETLLERDLSSWRLRS